MAQNVVVNGVTYIVPEQGDKFTWGAGQGGTPGVTPLLQALGAQTLQKTGGSFPLTNDVDFGSKAVKAGTHAAPNSAGGVSVPAANGGTTFGAEHDQPVVGVGGNPYTAGFLLGVSVRAMGAKGNGIDSDTAAFNAAVTRAKLLGYHTIYVQEGQYVIDGNGVDCTNITNGMTFKSNPGAIAQIKLKCTGKAGFDFTGSLFCRLEDLWIQGDVSTPPAAALLLSRNSTNSSAGSHIFRNLIITGWYTNTSAISISSESNEWVNCDIKNFRDGANAFSLTDQNETGIASAFATFPGVWSGGNTVTRFIGGHIGATGNLGTEHGIVLKGARDVSFHGTFFDGGSGDSCIYVSGDVTGLTITGGSAESQGMARGTMVVKSGATLANLSIQGLVAYKPIYGENTAIIRHSSIRAQLYGNPTYGLDVDVLENSDVSVSEFSARVRTSCSDVSFFGCGDVSTGTGLSASKVSLPSDATKVHGLTYTTDLLGSDGRRRVVKNIAREGLYSELATKWLSADMMRTRIKKIAASSYGSGFSTDLSTHGAYIDVTLDANLTLSSFAVAGPFASAGTIDEGARVSFLFRQDATGGRTVTFPAALKGTDRFAVRKAANAVTFCEFILDPDNLWQMVTATAPLYGTTTWDPANVADGAFTSTTLTVTGAVVGDVVSLGFSNAVPAGALLVGAVTAAGTVTATLFNKTGGAVDLASGTLTAVVTKV